MSTGPQKAATSSASRAVAGWRLPGCNARPPRIQPCTQVSAMSATAPAKKMSAYGFGSARRTYAAYTPKNTIANVVNQSAVRTLPSCSWNQRTTCAPESVVSGGEPDAIVPTA